VRRAPRVAVGAASRIEISLAAAAAVRDALALGDDAKRELRLLPG